MPTKDHTEFCISLQKHSSPGRTHLTKYKRRGTLRKHFSIGSSRASLAMICAVPEVEIWPHIYWLRIGVAAIDFSHITCFLQ